MTSSSSRVRSGCQNCRERHLKCDEARPACSRCHKAGIDCLRTGNIRFRHEYNPSISTGTSLGPGKRDYDFAQNQEWCLTNRTLNFVDETPDLVESFTVSEEYAASPATPGGDAIPTIARSRSSRPSESIFSAPTPNSLSDTKSVTRRWDTDAVRVVTPGSPTKRRKVDLPAPLRSLGSQTPVAGDATRVNSSPPAVPHPGPPLSLSPPTGHAYAPPSEAFAPLDAFEDTTQPSIIYETQDGSLPHWPLTDFEEAKLMRYWIDNLAHYLDLCDHQQHFALVVPYRASSCPPLLYAVFATAARHRFRHNKGPPYIAEKYHQRCLELLIPLLSNRSALLSEDLLAAAVILRFHEEMETSELLADSESHLSGTHIFMKAQERNVAPGGLRQAAFWVGLRMDLFFAFMNSRPVLPSIAIKTIDKSLAVADDCTWANRMVATCAEALQYSFGDKDDHTATYEELARYCENWVTFTPPSFTPIYFREPSGDRLFPEYWVLSDAVGTGLTHYYLTRILLTAYNPKMPRLGPRQPVAQREADEQIRHYVLTICGIADSNPRTPPYYVKACMAITLAGDRFSDRKQQETLLGIMERGANLGWPVLPAVRHLKDAWKWGD